MSLRPATDADLPAIPAHLPRHEAASMFPLVTLSRDGSGAGGPHGIRSCAAIGCHRQGTRTLELFDTPQEVPCR